jgi:hypothetical protein
MFLYMMQVKVKLNGPKCDKEEHIFKYIFFVFFIHEFNKGE